MATASRQRGKDELSWQRRPARRSSPRLQVQVCGNFSSPQAGRVQPLGYACVSHCNLPVAVASSGCRKIHPSDSGHAATLPSSPPGGRPVPERRRAPARKVFRSPSVFVYTMAGRISIWALLWGSLLAPAEASECRVPEVFYFEFASAESAAGLYARVASTLAPVGWWDFVCQNTDRVEFYNSPFLDVDAPHPVVGYATVKKGRRVMAIATYGYDLEEITRVMVHEAGHLEHVRRFGRFDDQSWAQKREREFLQTLAGSPAIPQKEINSERFLNWLIIIGGIVLVVLLLLGAPV